MIRIWLIVEIKIYKKPCHSGFIDTVSKSIIIYLLKTSKKMRRLMVGGNWKCNGTMGFAKSHTTDVLNKLKFDPKKVEVVVAPTNLHIPAVQAVVANNVNVAT